MWKTNVLTFLELFVVQKNEISTASDKSNILEITFAARKASTWGSLQDCIVYLRNLVTLAGDTLRLLLERVFTFFPHNIVAKDAYFQVQSSVPFLGCSRDNINHSH